MAKFKIPLFIAKSRNESYKPNEKPKKREIEKQIEKKRK